MHFSKTYTRLLLTLPEELRNNAIEYRQLKKLINELVIELDYLGLSPEVLQNLLEKNEDAIPRSETNKGKRRAFGERPSELEDTSPPPPTRAIDSIPNPSSTTKAAYEVSNAGEQGRLVPRLRLWMEEINVHQDVRSSSVIEDSETSDDPESQPHDGDDAVYMTQSNQSLNTVEPYVDNDAFLSSEEIIALHLPIIQHREELLWNLQERSRHSSSWLVENGTDLNAGNSFIVSNSGKSEKTNREVVISFASDTEFYRLLTNALNSLTAALANTRNDMTNSVNDLRQLVSQTARPASSKGQSDLYTWRSVFQIYMEAEVFESTHEADRGERDLEDSEVRLAQFVQRVANGHFKFKLKASREGLQRFLELNARLMNIKKFQYASAEAARKIMKKHAKRTALPVPGPDTYTVHSLDLNQGHDSISHILIVTLTESLLPVIPHIDDYLCLICTSLAFMPIRLNCRHLFCIRCLVKMQKRGQDHCPMCRAPNVLSANRSNLDLAVLNLMRDWFPKELKEKEKSNEKEVAKEELEAIGLDNRCRLM